MKQIKKTTVLIKALRFKVVVYLFACLFVYLEFIVHSKIFHSYGDVTIAGEGLQLLTYARHPWSLSSEGL